MFCCSSKKKDPNYFKVTPEEESELAIKRLNIYIDWYNREMVKLEDNIKILRTKAIESKKNNQESMSKYFLLKK